MRLAHFFSSSSGCLHFTVWIHSAGNSGVWLNQYTSLVLINENQLAAFLFSQGHRIFAYLGWISHDIDPNVANVLCFFGYRYRICWAQLRENWICSWIGLKQTSGNLFISRELADLETIGNRSCAGKPFPPGQVLLTARCSRMSVFMVDWCAIAHIFFYILLVSTRNILNGRKKALRDLYSAN